MASIRKCDITIEIQEYRTQDFQMQLTINAYIRNMLKVANQYRINRIFGDSNHYKAKINRITVKIYIIRI